MISSVKKVAGGTREKRRIACFFAFISPWIVGLLIFTAIPMAISFILSFTSAKVATITRAPLTFIGWDNYAYIFTRDPVFLRSIGNTFYFAILRVGFGIIFSVLLAVLFNKKIFGKKLWRTFLYVPSLVPVAASSLVWRLLLTQDNNLCANILAGWGIRDVNFLGSGIAMWTVLLISLIGGVGPTMIVVLAALQGVPRELEEAAIVDGAGGIRIFFHITLPMISSSIMFISVTGFIGALQTYAQIQLFTGGGPMNQTVTMAMQVVANAFAMDTFGIGYACAEAWIVFTIIMIFSLVYMKLINRQVYYGD